MQRLLIFLTVSVNFLFGDLVAPPAPSSLVDQPLDNDVLAAASNDNINALVETEAADGSYYDQYYNNNYGYSDPYSQFGYRYDYSEDDGLEERQGPTAADFIPFIASFSLPLTTAFITFVALVVVSAAFLLFPETIEIDHNSRKKRSIEEEDPVQNSLLSFPSGFCDRSTSKICRLLQQVLHSIECVERARCEVSQFSDSDQYPIMGSMVRPFIPPEVTMRFRGLDCASVKCADKKNFASKKILE